MPSRTRTGDKPAPAALPPIAPFHVTAVASMPHRRGAASRWHRRRKSVSPHRLIAVPIEVEAGPLPSAKGDKLAQEPVMQRNPGVIYGLGNLVENAIDFARSKVEVKARWSEDEVRIEIADDGEVDAVLELGERVYPEIERAAAPEALVQVHQPFLRRRSLRPSRLAACPR